jgi:hypothetical protein
VKGKEATFCNLIVLVYFVGAKMSRFNCRAVIINVFHSYENQLDIARFPQEHEIKRRLRRGIDG